MKSEKFGFLLLYVIALFIFSDISPVLAVESSSISVSVMPENPGPYEDVSISLGSYGSNLDSVLITWSVDGKNALSGAGKKSFSFKAPGGGAEITVVATVFLPDGEIEKRVVIRPAVMTLLWQANDSYVPPFYRGKAMPTEDSEIKVVAMPEIRGTYGLVSPKNLTYSWKKDYSNMQEESGHGKNFFTYVNDYLESTNNVSVVASTVDQKYGSEASADIGAGKPKILFYRADSTLGVTWEHALGTEHNIASDEIVVASPYFISPKDIRSPRLIWNWFINDSPVTVQGSVRNLMPLRAEGGVSGTSKLRLEIENKDKIFQATSKEINIQF